MRWGAAVFVGMLWVGCYSRKTPTQPPVPEKKAPAPAPVCPEQPKHPSSGPNYEARFGECQTRLQLCEIDRDEWQEMYTETLNSPKATATTSFDLMCDAQDFAQGKCELGSGASGKATPTETSGFWCATANFNDFPVCYRLRSTYMDYLDRQHKSTLDRCEWQENAACFVFESKLHGVSSVCATSFATCKVWRRAFAANRDDNAKVGSCKRY